MEEALADSHTRGPRSPRTVSSLKVNGGWYSQDISDRRRDRQTDRADLLDGMEHGSEADEGVVADPRGT